MVNDTFFDPLTFRGDPIAWALGEARALEAHANDMAESHGPNTPGVAVCRRRAEVLRRLADLAMQGKHG